MNYIADQEQYSRLLTKDEYRIFTEYLDDNYEELYSNKVGYMVEKIEELVARQTEAIANLKIDKITVWDSGNNGGEGGATSNFVSSLIQSLPPVHDVAKMAGVDLPDYLGTMKDE